MYDFKQIEIEKVVVHQVGNRAKEGKLILSDMELDLDEYEKAVLLTYYLHQFKTDEYFCFNGEQAASPETRFNGNRMYNIVRDLFKATSDFASVSQDSAKMLYELTTNSKIKSGELHVVRFQYCILDEEVCNAVGLFKTETKEPFIKLPLVNNAITVERHEGINIKKIDRACLIFNTDAEEGYRILNYDKNKAELAAHWQYDFLSIKQRKENFYNTNNFISLVKNFSDEVLIEENNIAPADQIAFVQRTEDYLKHADNFQADDFANEVIGNPEITKAFEEYIPGFESDFDVQIQDNFPISKQAVKSSKKYFKSVLKLDKSFHVYVHTNPDNLEKGYDASRDMKYYKLYFREEE